MMYHQFDELSVDAFQASEMLSGPDAVMRRFVGVVGAVRSRAGPAADAALKINETARMIPAKPVRLTDMRLLPKKVDLPRVRYGRFPAVGLPADAAPQPSGLI